VVQAEQREDRGVQVVDLHFVRRFTILAVKKNGGGSPRRGKGVNANPTPIPV
jgi:hypothetical protein